MARAIWKGTISFGLVTIPVGLFSAVSAEELSFHLLDSRDFSAVHNKRVNENTGEEVPWEAIVKGYQLPDGRWVTVTDDDFAAANVKATRTIDVLGAVCEDDVAVEFFDTPYFLAPEPQGTKAYALLRE
ncbi:MAG: Ku protein, partial [Coriobacteriia bacterium]|nr:Ku protein [Coriobacteriia bacterium]